jgi:hypothetical protein
MSTPIGSHRMSRHAPAMMIGAPASRANVTIDAVSHEGILEDQGRNPVEFFGGHGVAEADVLDDAKAIAAEYKRTPRNFVNDGPRNLLAFSQEV